MWLPVNDRQGYQSCTPVLVTMCSVTPPGLPLGGEAPFIIMIPSGVQQLSSVNKCNIHGLPMHMQRSITQVETNLKHSTDILDLQLLWYGELALSAESAEQAGWTRQLPHWIQMRFLG